MKKARFSLFRRPLTYVILAGIIIVAAAAFFVGSSDGKVETMTIKRADFMNQVSLSGKVIPTDSAELGFDQSGRLSASYVAVGDTVAKDQILAEIENSEIRSDVLQKRAALDREYAKLRSLQTGTRQEELSIDEQKYSDSKTVLVEAIRLAYLQTENAIQTDADSVFLNANSVNPTLTIRTKNEDFKKQLENERSMVSEKLETWKDTLAALPSVPNDEAIQGLRTVSKDSITYIKNFLNHLGTAASELNTYNSGMTDAEIETYRSDINNASQTVTDAATSALNAESTWSTARENLNLSRSGSRIEDIEAQEAEVKVAEANLVAAQSRLAKTFIRSPFDGIITKMDAKLGEIISPNDSKFAVMSNNAYQIESFVPEVNISELNVGNPATVTLDAYGEDQKFQASIISIDPAETLRDGVSTYKIRLQFSENDPRIKSGMTANVTITTDKRSGVISVPKGIIQNEDGEKFVKVLRDEEITEVPVTIGNSSSMGVVEITSGLNEGDVVVLNP